MPVNCSIKVFQSWLWLSPVFPKWKGQIFEDSDALFWGYIVLFLQALYERVHVQHTRQVPPLKIFLVIVCTEFASGKPKKFHELDNLPLSSHSLYPSSPPKGFIVGTSPKSDWRSQQVCRCSSTGSTLILSTGSLSLSSNSLSAIVSEPDTTRPSLQFFLGAWPQICGACMVMPNCHPCHHLPPWQQSMLDLNCIQTEEDSNTCQVGTTGHMILLIQMFIALPIQDV